MVKVASTLYVLHNANAKDMTMTWTKADLAELTVQAMLRDEGYCEHCQVVPVGYNEKYCIKCTEVMLDDMARWYREQLLAEQGLY